MPIHRMRLTRLLTGAVLGLSALGVTVPATAQDLPEAFEIDVSDWTGGAVLNEEADTFRYCTVSRTYPEGFTISLALSPEGMLNVVYGRPDLGLTPGSQALARLSIDGGTGRDLAAVAVKEDEWVIQTGRDDELRDRLKRGSVLTIAIEGQAPYDVPLTGTFRSIAALEDCVGTAVQMIRAAQAQRSLMSAEQLGGLLAEAGLTGIELADARDNPNNPLGIRFIWRLSESGIFGALHQSPRTPEVRMRGFLNGFTGILQGSCDGEFVNQVAEPELFGDGYAFGEAVSTCMTDGTRSSVFIFAVLDDVNYTLFYHEGSGDLADTAREATEAVAATIRASAG